MPVVWHPRVSVLRPLGAVAAIRLGGLVFGVSLIDVHAATLRTRASRVKAEMLPHQSKTPHEAGLDNICCVYLLGGRSLSARIIPAKGNATKAAAASDRSCNASQILPMMLVKPITNPKD